MVLFYLFILKIVRRVLTSEFKYKIIITFLGASESQFSLLIYNPFYFLSLIEGNKGPILIIFCINSSSSRNSSGLNIAAETLKNSRYNSENILLTFIYLISIIRSFSASYFNRMNIF